MPRSGWEGVVDTPRVRGGVEIGGGRSRRESRLGHIRVGDIWCVFVGTWCSDRITNVKEQTILVYFLTF